MNPIQKSYIICATPRTGSNFLCEVLSATGVAGRPDEYFWNPPFWHERWGVADLTTFVDRMLQEGTTPNGIFGVKIMWGYLDEILLRLAARAGLSDSPPSEILAATFPNLHYIWLTRKDKLRQAISFYRAVETNLWRSTDVARVDAPDAVFDREVIERYLELCIDEDRAWQEFFKQHAIAPLPLVYEDLVADVEAAVTSILGYLGVTPPAGKLPARWQHQRQADALTEQWVQEYLDGAEER